jgi:integration host factor subunit beta
MSTRSEIISNVQNKTKLSAVEVKKIFDIVFGQVIPDVLKEGGRLEIRGFGSMTVRKRESRTARNPKTNEVISLPERMTPYFRSGKLLNQRINQN